MVLKNKNKQMVMKDRRETEKIKRKKRNRIIAGVVAGACVISLLSGLAYQTGLFGKKDSKREIETVKKEESKDDEKAKEDEAKKKLEELKRVDISKLSEVDKKETEEKIKSVEDMINKKEYDKVKSVTDTLKANIDNKLKELDKVEENKTEKEVSSNNSSSEATNNNEVSSNNVVNEVSNNSSNNVNNNSSVTTETEYSEPKVVEEKIQNTELVKVQEPTNTTPISEPEPPVEQPKPVYPSVEEVKQRLISYGQSLGLTYDPSVISEGWNFGGTQQMWDPRVGTSADQQTLFNGFDKKRFAIIVNDLGEYCDMQIYASWE
ncbi:MAG: hypothetical protein ACI33I_05865 [Clostridium sp.]